MKKRKKTVLKKHTRRFLVFGISSFFVIAVVLVSVSKIVLEIIDKYKEASELEEKKIALEEKEKDLNNEILKLQDQEYLAGYAREKYFYSKNGELIIRIPSNKE